MANGTTIETTESCAKTEAPEVLTMAEVAFVETINLLIDSLT